MDDQITYENVKRAVDDQGLLTLMLEDGQTTTIGSDMAGWELARVAVAFKFNHGQPYSRAGFIEFLYRETLPCNPQQVGLEMLM